METFLKIFFSSCRFPKTCIPFPSYQKINPNTQIVIDGECLQNCFADELLFYKYDVYFTNALSLSKSTIWNKAEYYEDFISGEFISKPSKIKKFFKLIFFN